MQGNDCAVSLYTDLSGCGKTGEVERVGQRIQNHRYTDKQASRTKYNVNTQKNGMLILQNEVLLLH